MENNYIINISLEIKSLLEEAFKNKIFEVEFTKDKVKKRKIKIYLQDDTQNDELGDMGYKLHIYLESSKIFFLQEKMIIGSISIWDSNGLIISYSSQSVPYGNEEIMNILKNISKKYKIKIARNGVNI